MTFWTKWNKWTKKQKEAGLGSIPSSIVIIVIILFNCHKAEDPAYCSYLQRLLAEDDYYWVQEQTQLTYFI